MRVIVTWGMWRLKVPGVSTSREWGEKWQPSSLRKVITGRWKHVDMKAVQVVEFKADQLSHKGKYMGEWEYAVNVGWQQAEIYGTGWEGDERK